MTVVLVDMLVDSHMMVGREVIWENDDGGRDIS